jgi:Protein of unknown function (DUF2721)
MVFHDDALLSWSLLLVGLVRHLGGNDQLVVGNLISPDVFGNRTVNSLERVVLTNFQVACIPLHQNVLLMRVKPGSLALSFQEPGSEVNVSGKTLRPLHHRETMNAVQLISASVTPVVLISACGLITLALYSRLGMILARIRAFHQQKIELLKEPECEDGEQQQMLFAMIDSQITKVTFKAKVIQNGLYCLLCAVLAFLLCCLLSAAAELHMSVGVIALAMHVLGVSLFLVGIGWAIRELTLSLTPLEEESAYLESLTAQGKRRSQSNQKIKVAKSA